MILGHFEGREYSFKELDLLSGKLPGKWTWPTQTFLWLLKHGYEVRLIEEFSYEAFGLKGKDYILEIAGNEIAQAQELNSDIEREQHLALEFSKKGLVEYRIPTLEDINQLIKEGYLIICNINASMLYFDTGYSGHFIIPIEVTPHNVTIHDPGLPAKPSQVVPKTSFEKAWAYPNEKAKNIAAIRKKS